MLTGKVYVLNLEVLQDFGFSKSVVNKYVERALGLVSDANGKIIFNSLKEFDEFHIVKFKALQDKGWEMFTVSHKPEVASQRFFEVIEVLFNSLDIRSLSKTETELKETIDNSLKEAPHKFVYLKDYE